MRSLSQGVDLKLKPFLVSGVRDTWTPRSADYLVSARRRSLTQYNSSTHEVTNSIRFNVIYRRGSDLYIVYNDLQQAGLQRDVFAPSDRQLVVKLNVLVAR